MDRKRFKKQVAFILEADKEKNILRQTHLSGHGRRENDAEHAWHMAMMIYLLKEYENAEKVWNEQLGGYKPECAGGTGGKGGRADFWLTAR